MTVRRDETERMIAQSALEFADQAGGLRRVRALRDRGVAFDGEAWGTIAGLGWIGICVPEASGGLGLGVREACVLLEAIGRRLVPEPLASAIAGGLVLGTCPGAAPAAALASLLAGEITCRLVDGASAPPSGTPVAGDAAEPSGLAVHDVPDACGPARFLVALGRGERFALRLVEVDGSRAAVSRLACVDGSVLTTFGCSADELQRAPLLARGREGEHAFETGLAAMRLGDAAYLVGLMDEALRLSVEYLSQRVQFGVPLASFQVLQHRAASCYVDVTSARALVYEACRPFATPSQTRASAAALARASEAALRVTKESIQFHGSMGFADESDIGLYLRRAMAVVGRMGGALANKQLLCQGAAALRGDLTLDGRPRLGRAGGASASGAPRPV